MFCINYYLIALFYWVFFNKNLNHYVKKLFVHSFQKIVLGTGISVLKTYAYVSKFALPSFKIYTYIVLKRILLKETHKYNYTLYIWRFSGLTFCQFCSNGIHLRPAERYRSVISTISIHTDIERRILRFIAQKRELFWIIIAKLRATLISNS